MYDVYKYVTIRSIFKGRLIKEGEYYHTMHVWKYAILNFVFKIIDSLIVFNIEYSIEINIKLSKKMNINVKKYANLFTAGSRTNIDLVSDTNLFSLTLIHTLYKT